MISAAVMSSCNVVDMSNDFSIQAGSNWDLT